ncbi:precorrin-6A/cobalt-precorrin-6A reductase [Natranaerovirga pectinivora]|uniref:Precorrin-6A/cobalt-precorrin-6A reductase n=1 Tax=Natranaerovirga pectinivora TaxID=682400 RepID=A0A4V2V035_9FIRM|nr:precorrin-6A reductase [Natranaerovirga pectinivora]TCT13792.1 precorrin-6A/cobalt-precorrin-6A reductase [Natranaerovirga pectinivora]
MILLLGGTSDGLKLAKELYAYTKDIIMSTATDYGHLIAEEAFQGKVIWGQMDERELLAFCEAYKINHIIDATHPYAQIISENAIKVCKALNINYWRYERPASIEDNIVNVIWCKDYYEAGEYINKREGNVLVTTGSRHIDKFLEGIENIERVFVRVLPITENIKKLENLKLTPKQIIAIQGPFSMKMNKEMLDHIKAKFLLTKESGTIGHTKEKIEAALHCGVEVIMIKRPLVQYPNVYETIEGLIGAIKRTAM